MSGGPPPEADPIATDPNGVRAIRQMMMARSRAAATGVTIDPASEDSFIKEETQGKFGRDDAQRFIGDASELNPRNVVQQAGNGVLAGWAPDVVGLVKGKDAEDQMRAENEAFESAHPHVTTAAKIAGGIVPWLAAPEVKAVQALGLGSKMAAGAALGVTSGAVAGAGEAGPGSRIPGAVAGGLSGLALGAAAPAAGEGAAAVAGKLAGAAPLTSAQKLVAAAIARDPAAAQKSIADAIATGRGHVLSVADLNDATRGLADRSANMNPDAWDALHALTASRQAGQSERLLNDVTDAVGNPVADQRVAELKRVRDEWAAGPTGYQGLRDAAHPIDPTDLTAFQHPAVKAAIGQARLAGDMEPNTQVSGLVARIMGDNPGWSPEHAAQFAASGGGSLYGAPGGAAAERPLQFGDVFDLKNIAEDKAQAAKVSGKGNLMNAWLNVKDAANTTLAKVPGYAEARAEYARHSGLMDAVQQGVEAANQSDTRGLAKQVAALSPDELEQFRAGMASQLITKLRSTGTNRSQADELLSGGPALQDKLGLVFKSPDVHDAFLDAARVESKMARLRSATGGSSTAQRQAGQADAGDAVAGIVGGAMGHAPGAIAATGARMALRSMSDATARAQAGEVGNVLATQGTDAIQQLMASFQRPMAAPGPAAGGAAGGAAGQIIPGLLNH